MNFVSYSGEAPRLIFKWFCFLPLLEITKPDYIKDSVPIITAADQGMEKINKIMSSNLYNRS